MRISQESHLETEAIAKKLTDRVGKTLVKAGALTEESASKLQHLVGSVTEYAMKDPTTPVAQPEQTAAERELAAKRAIESLKEDQGMQCRATWVKLGGDRVSLCDELYALW